MATPPDFSVGQVLTAAQMNAVGLWVLATDSFTGQSSRNFDDVYGTDYDTFLIQMRYKTSANNQVQYQNRVGGSNAASEYYWQELIAGSTSVTAQRAANQAQFIAGYGTDDVWSFSTILVNQPNAADRTLIRTDFVRHSLSYATNSINFDWGNHSVSTAYDGFRLFVATGTFDANVTVYGYNK